MPNDTEGMIVIRCVNPRCKRKHWAILTKDKDIHTGEPFYSARCTLDDCEDYYTADDAIESNDNA